VDGPAVALGPRPRGIPACPTSTLTFSQKHFSPSCDGRRKPDGRSSKKPEWVWGGHPIQQALWRHGGRPAAKISPGDGVTSRKEWLLWSITTPLRCCAQPGIWRSRRKSRTDGRNPRVGVRTRQSDKNGQDMKSGTRSGVSSARPEKIPVNPTGIMTFSPKHFSPSCDGGRKPDGRSSKKTGTGPRGAPDSRSSLAARKPSCRTN